MKISVITATWNSEKTILDTIESMKSQKYTNVEYIVIDGGSQDLTTDIVDTHSSFVDLFISEPDKGIYDALNKGIVAASGDVIGFLHSDDVYAHKNVLNLIASALGESDADCVYGDLNYVSKENTNKVIRQWKSGLFSRASMRNGWMPPHPTFYMKRECYLKYGLFDLSYKIAADYDSILRYLWKNQISATYIPEVLVNMRVGGESNRSLKNIFSKSKEDLRAMRANGLPAARALFGKNISKIPQFLPSSFK